MRVRANIPKLPRSKSTATAKASAAIGTKKADRNDLVKHGSDSFDGLDQRVDPPSSSHGCSSVSWIRFRGRQLAE